MRPLALKKALDLFTILHDLLKDFLLMNEHIKLAYPHIRVSVLAAVRIIKNLADLIVFASPKLEKELEGIAKEVKEYLEETIKGWQIEESELEKLPPPTETPEITQKIEAKINKLKTVIKKMKYEYTVAIFRSSKKTPEEFLESLPPEAQKEIEEFAKQFRRAVKEWMKYGFTENEASDWISYGFTLEQALLWKKQDVTPEEAIIFRKQATMGWQ